MTRSSYQHRTVYSSIHVSSGADRLARRARDRCFWGALRRSRASSRWWRSAPEASRPTQMSP